MKKENRTLLDQITHRASNLFDRYIWVNAVLIEQVDRVDAEPLQRVFYGQSDVLGTAAKTPAA